MPDTDPVLLFDPGPGPAPVPPPPAGDDRPAGRGFKPSDRDPDDRFAWLDGGIPAAELAIKVKPPAPNRSGKSRGSIQRLESENRWPEYLEWRAASRYRQDYATAVGVSLSTLDRWERKFPERQAELDQALELAADIDVQRAERVLRTVMPIKEDLIAAKNLADFYRWRAERLSPRYTDKAKWSGESSMTVRVIRERAPTVAETKAAARTT